MEEKLQIISVNKIYKLENKQTFQALYDINVEFQAGELVSIVGESGSGKSTLMNLIGGLDSDFTGTIIADGENLSKLTDKQLDNYRKNKVGFVFQSFNLISHLSILDNVTLALTLSNVPEKEKVARATEILKRVGLESQLKKKPTQLSGGQKQRVAIARALINDPEIIIADEPTGALDSTTSMQILEILKEIADSGKLVIMVTHSEKVASVSSRVVEISDGRIIGDHKNENYVPFGKADTKKEKSKKKSKKAEDENEETEEESSSNSFAVTAPHTKKRNGKDKQNLSMYSAIRLSLHNMWASKTKNILMAIGVAIGIGSLILMMCFSSGITDFIDDTMKSYSDPTIATVSKKIEMSEIENIGDADIGGFEINPIDLLGFNDKEIEEVKQTIRDGLKQHNYDDEYIDSILSPEKFTYGFQLTTIIIPKVDAFVNYYDYNIQINKPVKTSTIMCVYTIPPYYSEKNLISGTMSKPVELDSNNNIVSGGGFMFTKGISSLFNYKGAPDEEIDPVGKEVNIKINVDGTDIEWTDKICGIMDTSFMSGFLTAYVDYDYLKTMFELKGQSISFRPTDLYINTGDETVTNIINDIMAKTEKYSGSIEETLAGMFENMSSVIGTSLIVISCISLLVSAMMILVVLYMSVSERTKEIGVLKSIGARRKDIKRIFTSESFLIGLLSGICGIVFNLILTLVIWLLLQNLIGFAPITYRWWYFFLAIGVSVVISMLSGLYPASKAAKLDPVESLRRE